MGCGCGKKLSQTVQGNAPQARTRTVGGASAAQSQARAMQSGLSTSRTVEVPYQSGRSGRQMFIRKTV